MIVASVIALLQHIVKIHIPLLTEDFVHLPDSSYSNYDLIKREPSNTTSWQLQIINPFCD